MILKDLLRGRGGSEWAIVDHAVGEAFVLVDDALVQLDPIAIDDAPSALIVVTGMGDDIPVTSAIAAQGSTRRPFTPVHGKAARLADGSVVLSWVRRARGVFAWRDSVETPLNEQSESYEVVVEDPASRTMRWVVGTSNLTIDAATAAILASGTARAIFRVAQLGNAAASFALTIAMPD